MDGHGRTNGKATVHFPLFTRQSREQISTVFSFEAGSREGEGRRIVIRSEMFISLSLLSCLDSPQFFSKIKKNFIIENIYEKNTTKLLLLNLILF